MPKDSSGPDRLGLGLVATIFLVLPLASLLVGGELPALVLSLLLLLGAPLLILTREWWWGPVREYVRADRPRGDRR